MLFSCSYALTPIVKLDVTHGVCLGSSGQSVQSILHEKHSKTCGAQTRFLSGCYGDVSYQRLVCQCEFTLFELTLSFYVLCCPKNSISGYSHLH